VGREIKQADLLREIDSMIPLVESGSLSEIERVLDIIGSNKFRKPYNHKWWKDIKKQEVSAFKITKSRHNYGKYHCPKCDSCRDDPLTLQHTWHPERLSINLHVIIAESHMEKCFRYKKREILQLYKEIVDESKPARAINREKMARWEENEGKIWSMRKLIEKDPGEHYKLNNISGDCEHCGEQVSKHYIVKERHSHDSPKWSTPRVYCTSKKCVNRRIKGLNFGASNLVLENSSVNCEQLEREIEQLCLENKALYKSINFNPGYSACPTKHPKYKKFSEKMMLFVAMTANRDKLIRYLEEKKRYLSLNRKDYKYVCKDCAFEEDRPLIEGEDQGMKSKTLKSRTYLSYKWLKNTFLYYQGDFDAYREHAAVLKAQKAAKAAAIHQSRRDHTDAGTVNIAVGNANPNIYRKSRTKRFRPKIIRNKKRKIT